MKKIIFLFSAVLALGSTPARASGILIELKESGGNPSNPRSFDLKVMSTGEVTLTTIAYRLDYNITKSIANLSEETMAKLQKLVHEVPENASVVDIQGGEPNCNDDPDTEISVIKETTPMRIAARTKCHQFEIRDDLGSKSISNFMKTLMEVSY